MSDKVDTSPLKSESSAVNEPVPKANTFNKSHLAGTINTTSNTIVEQDETKTNEEETIVFSGKID